MLATRLTIASFWALVDGDTTMKIKVNGDIETIAACTLEEYLNHKDLNSPALVVEHNRQIVKQHLWGKIRLRENDTLELLRFVGGG